MADMNIEASLQRMQQRERFPDAKPPEVDQLLRSFRMATQQCRHIILSMLGMNHHGQGTHISMAKALLERNSQTQ